MTSNNIERTGQRDMEASRKMRLPNEGSPGCTGLRSFDVDPFIICDECALPVALVEWTRKMDGYKPTRYTRTMAEKMGCPYYLARHNGAEGGKTLIEDLFTGAVFTLRGDEEFKTWGENLYREHKARCIPHIPVPSEAFYRAEE
jgi:hypothetical protein